MIISVINHKGGVGKTSVAMNVAASLAGRGYRGLLIDADAQGTLTYALGVQNSGGLYNALVRDVSIRQHTVAIAPDRYLVDGGPSEGWLGVLPGNNETRNLSATIQNWELLDALEPLKDVFDFIMIDSSPAEQNFHGAVYLASDAVFVPSLCEDWAVDGVRRTFQYLNRVQRYRAAEGLPETRVLAIVPTMYDVTNALHPAYLEQLQEEFGQYPMVDPVKRHIEWSYAASAKTPLHVYSPRHKAAADVARLTDLAAAALGVLDVE